MGARRVRRRLHAAVHRLPHQPAGLWDGIHDGLAYWLGQHGPGRGGKAWYFYVVVLFAEEWPALLLGARRRRRRAAAGRRCCGCSWSGTSRSRSPSTAGRASTSPGSCCTRCCRCCCWRASACRRSGTRAGAGRPRSASSLVAACAALRRLRVVVGERRERRRPARVPRHHAVGRAVKGVRDEVLAVAGARRARGPRRARHRRHRGGRDVPVGVVLPRPAGRLPRPHARRRCRPTPTP